MRFQNRLRRSRQTLDISSLSWLAALIGCATLLAVGVVLKPWITTALVVLAMLAAIAGRGLARTPETFLYVLGVILIGYAWLGRGFAYLGLPPVFLGEIVLALGLLALLFSSRGRRLPKGPVPIVLLAYMFWGLLQTLPHLREYGLVALRDAVVWGYAVFALLVATALTSTGLLRRAVVGYSVFLPWFLIWAPIGLWLSLSSSEWGLMVPGSPHVDLILLKPGDMAVHLAGVAVFIAMGLHAFGRRRSDPGFAIKEWLWWGLWLAGFVFAASLSRGGMLAVLTAGLAALVLRPTARWMKVGLVGLVIGGAFLMANVELETKRIRSASPQQIVANLVSIVGDAPREGLEGTRRWREEWWSDIIDYTVGGPHFWTGKGFGINLAIDDGIISARSQEVGRLRSPHNAHLTILARSGVPGFLLWGILNVMFVVSLLRAYFSARRHGFKWWARIDVWLFAYWVAFMVNMTFDVYLEGPQGGIWYWSLMGFGLAAIESQRREFVAGVPKATDRSNAGHHVERFERHVPRHSW